MSVVTIGKPTDWLADWNTWHSGREQAALEPFGIASVVATAWLDEEPRPVEGLPGLWSRQGDSVSGEDLGSELGEATLISAADGQVKLGDIRVKALVRADQVAVRVFNADAPTRQSLRGIATFEPDQEWVLQGTFDVALQGQTVAITHVDGFESTPQVVGVVRAEVDSQEIGLVAFAAEGGGLQITFADQTNGTTSQQFRFLTLPAPTADGAVMVDFNRAYLPPCAFTDHYLCPLPPAENRLKIAVTAGESFLDIERES